MNKKEQAISGLLNMITRIETGWVNPNDLIIVYNGYGPYGIGLSNQQGIEKERRLELLKQATELASIDFPK